MKCSRWKWAFFIVCAVLLSTWIASRWVSLFCIFRGGVTAMLSQGVVHFSDFGPQNASRPGISMERVNDPSGFKWWFSAQYFQGKGWIEIPLWTPLCFVILIVIGVVALRFIKRTFARKGRCPKCNYDRVGLPDATPCPECGALMPNHFTEVLR